MSELQLRDAPFLINVGPDGEQAALMVATALPNLTQVAEGETGQKDYEPLLETVLDVEGKPRGWSGIAVVSIFDQDLDGKTLLSVRGPHKASQPNVLGASCTERFVRPDENPPSELLTRALGGLTVVKQTATEHLFDVLSREAWQSWPSDRIDALSAIAVSAMVRKLGFGPGLVAGDVRFSYAAESLRLGVAFNRQVGVVREFELGAFTHIIAVLETGANKIRESNETPTVVWAEQAEAKAALETRDLRYLSSLPADRALDVCAGGECIGRTLSGLSRLEQAREQGVDLVALTAQV